jgi:hypothetical protein
MAWEFQSVQIFSDSAQIASSDRGCDGNSIHISANIGAAARTSVALDNLRGAIILIVLGFNSALASVSWMAVIRAARRAASG